MQPVRLYIKNFCAHSETEFSFNDFSSALIIGKVKNNDRFSNGAGKSTVFNAIEYVLFNEVHFSALEKVIRDGCDVCRVEFDFVSSLDKHTYRIVRSNSRKTGTDVRLFKQAEGNKWEDLTQRRVSDTEKEIIKIVGFNYKAFCASVLFSQFGSENNVQKDFGNLPYLTPEKRKSVLREVLQLNVYANYEKLAKTKYSSLVSELDTNKKLLQNIEGAEEKLDSLNKELLIANKSLKIKDSEIGQLESSNLKLNTKLSTFKEAVVEASTKLYYLKAEEEKYNSEILKAKSKENYYKSKIDAIPVKKAQLGEQIENESKKVFYYRQKYTDVSKLKSQLDHTITHIIKNRGDQKVIINNIKEYDTPIIEDKTCNYCHQVISAEHKHNWDKERLSKLELFKQNISEIDASYEYLLSEKVKKEKEINQSESLEKEIHSSESLINALLKEQDSQKPAQQVFEQELNEANKSIKENNDKLEEVKIKINEVNAERSKINDYEYKLLITTCDEEKRKIAIAIEHKNKLCSDIAVFNHQIEVYTKHKIQSALIESGIQNLEKSILLHSKVVQAFGSNGIPSLITHSILDELQEEANKWLLKLRPGLQLQFVVINDKDKKEKEDTLDILYFIDGNQREYKQLSGAQKIIASLSIKLGLLYIMNKRLGVDVKLILLDEVDQALDPGSTEIFADIIKVIQDEFKVMVITHDEELKHKFSHAILVEQDENNISRGKLINW